MTEIANVENIKSLDSEQLAILVVDDNPDDRTLAIREIRKQFPNAIIKEVINKSQFNEELKNGDFDLVITDYRLRYTTGLEVLRKVKSNYPKIPVIMFTGTGTEEIAVEAMKKGLNDYIVKSPKHFIRLSASVKSIVEQMREKEQAKKVLKRTKLEYKTIFENTGTATIIFDDKYKIKLVNNEFEKLFGYDRGYIMNNKKLTDFILKKDIDKIKDNMENLTKKEDISKSNLQVRLINKYGNIRFTLFNIAIIPESDRYVASILDITKYKKTIEALTSIEEIFRKTFDNSELGILILSPDGKILEVNNSFVDLIEYDELELISMNYENLIHQKDYSMDLCEKIRSQDKQVFREEIKHKTKSGKIIENSIIASIVKDYNDKIEYILVQVI